MTPSGIEPATFRFVAQHLNHAVCSIWLKLQKRFYRARWHGKGRCYGNTFWPVVRVCSSLYREALLEHFQIFYNFNCIYELYIGALVG